MLHRITQGLDIPIAGTPEQVVSDHPGVTSVALLGHDYAGLSPAMRVREGDRVKLGQALFAERRHPDILFTSPGAGVVTAINRGARRTLLSIVVGLDGDETESFPHWPAAELGTLGRDQVAGTLLASGLWTALRARPYNKVPEPGSAPRSIFVTAVDTNPLAARPEVVVSEHPDDFSHGLTVLSRLTEGSVFVCAAPNVELPQGASERISPVAFSGPHPSGLVGTHIHLLDPVGARGRVWHVGYQDVIAIGKLFITGQTWCERIVALGGPVVERPRLMRTRLGAEIDALTEGELSDPDARVVSGSVLSGRRVRQPENYLGRFHTQVSALAEAGEGDAAGWLGGGKSFSSHSLLVSGQPAKRRFAFSSARHGRRTAMVPLGGYERVMPLDILPTQLLRALLVGDTDMAQGLGCLELDEEDLALCTFVCPSKLDYGPLLREALSSIEKEG
jgi:Na+-transporting NADH:ubiquinone oxidoreductase subunit A